MPQKTPYYQLLLIFHLDLPPQDMNLTPVLVILLLKFLLVIRPISMNLEILFPLEVWVSLFHNMFLCNVHGCLFNKTQTINIYK